MEGGDLQIFNLKDKVSIKRHQTALVPVNEYEIDAQRIICYNKKAKKIFPMKAIEVINSTGNTLEGGNCVVLEDDKYIGESYIVNVKPDEPQLVTYAVEKNIGVKMVEKTDHLNPHVIKFFNSTKNIYVDNFDQAESLKTFFTVEKETTYTLTNRSENNYEVFYLDHFIDLSMELSEENKKDLHDFQTSEIFKRFVLKLEPQETKTYKVVETKENSKSHLKRYLDKTQLKTFKQYGIISEMLEKEILEYISIETKIDFIKRYIFTREYLPQLLQEEYISKDLHKELSEYYELMDERDMMNEKIEVVTEQLNEVFEDEKRLRENLKILSSETSDLKSKY